MTTQHDESRAPESPQIDYQRLLNSVDDPLVAVDSRCRIIAFNRACEDITGFRASELLDQPCTELFTGQSRGPICRARATQGETDARHDVEIARRSGTPLPVTVTTAPLFDDAGSVVGAIETIHVRESGRLDRHLQQENSHKLAILDSLAEGVITVDREWRISSCNGAAATMLGREPADLMGKFCSQVLQTELCSNGCPLARALEDDVPGRDRHVSMTRADGGTIEVSLNTGVLRSDDGEALGGVLSFRPLPVSDPVPTGRNRSGGFMGFIGASPAMRRVYRLIQEVADSDATVLITGESGTGKELAASALQRLSGRQSAPFVKTSCAVFSETLLESELFGHVKGAFTDASSDRRGRFELAHNGTFFLDEIGDLSSLLQVKLLRVLQEREFERVGGEDTVKVDVRLIAATHRDLPALVTKGEFREDLYYRLNVIPIHLPPLRERRQDIPVLADHFLRIYRERADKDVTGFDQATIDVLSAHAWPGNVRQLENAIEHAVARVRGRVITEDLLPPEVRYARARSQPEALQTEASRILAALYRHHWHHERAAQELGVSRTTLWRRIKKLGLEPNNR